MHFQPRVNLSMLQTNIFRIPVLPFHMVNCFLVKGKAGCILVDTGLPGSEHKINKVLRKHGLSFTDIKLIVITHAHIDHAGSAARLRELSGAPIVAHMGDLKHYLQEEPMTFCPTHWSARLFRSTGLPSRPYVAFHPDILLVDDEQLDLNRYGVDGIILTTIGHTAGSISVILPSREALVGDLVASGVLIGGIARLKHATSPPFEDDPQAVSRELQRLIDSGVNQFHMGHGGPLDSEAVQQHVVNLTHGGKPASKTA